MRQIIIHTVLLLLVASNIQLQAQNKAKEKWKLINNEGGFQLYSRGNTISKIDEIRITFYVSSTLDRISAVINDVNNYENWVYQCERSQKKEMVSENEFDFYLRTNFPFPLADRDMLVSTKQIVSRENNTYYSHSKLKRSEKKFCSSCEPMNYFESTWEAKEITPNTYKVDYRVLADPAGDIPAWAVNMAITKGPIESMKRFKKLVEVENKNELSDAF